MLLQNHAYHVNLLHVIYCLQNWYTLEWSLYAVIEPKNSTMPATPNILPFEKNLITDKYMIDQVQNKVH